MSQSEICWTHGKVLPQQMRILNIKALAFIVLKLLASLRFQKVGQTPRSRSEGKKC